MKQIEFYRALKEYCTWKSKGSDVNCEDCCLRLYCYTPPCARTDDMMNLVINFLALEQTRMGGHVHLDHYNAHRQPECPCTLDMTTALGWDALPPSPPRNPLG